MSGDPTDDSTSHHMRKALTTRTHVVHGHTSTSTYRRMVETAQIRKIIFPWMKGYKAWWVLTVILAMFTIVFEPYMIAFQKEAGMYTGAGEAIEYFMTAVFLLDIGVNFNLAYCDKDGVMVFDRKQIFKTYFRRMFWVDFVGVFPFDLVALAIAGEIGSTSNKALLISLLRLLRFVRAHRVKPLSDILQYNAKVSLLVFTLLRNLAAGIGVTNFSACIMYLLARLRDFGEDTWIGPLVFELNGVERYIVSLYWSITTFSTVGYGDFSPVNAVEQVWGMIFMCFNIIVQSWIIGSITLLIVKGDEKTGEYRESLKVLNQYSEMHDFDEQFTKKLKTQLRLEFHNREIADEQILQHFPSAVRRKVLRKLYLPSLIKTSLMKGIRQQFVDAFLTACSVEIFSPGEEIVERGAISGELFLLVDGIAEITTPEYMPATTEETSGSVEGTDADSDEISRNKHIEAGNFIGDIAFFTESPQLASVSCLTVCKTLTMSRSAYKLIAEDHPGSTGKILQNLLDKVQEMSRQMIHLPKNLSLLRAGSVYDLAGANADISTHSGMDEATLIKHKQEALTATQDLVKMHMEKQKDDQTTRFLFAASRGDTATISLMCDQGFDPNNADYDNRTALMVGSMKGNTDVVKMILEYRANPNLTDVHGSSALYEAVKNGNDSTVDLLLEHGAELCMGESLAASVLCQAVFDGDIPFLRRLLRAGIQVNASDYDKRTAAHIAAAEGNCAALKVLVDYGADLSLEDRWKNTVEHEAKRADTQKLLDYLATIKK